jgi:hypothetical protein
MYNIAHLVITSLNDIETVQEWLDEHLSIKIDSVIFNNCDIYIFYKEI